MKKLLTGVSRKAIIGVVAGMMALSGGVSADQQTLTADFAKCEATFYGVKWNKEGGAVVGVCIENAMVIHFNSGTLAIIKNRANDGVKEWDYTSPWGSEYDEHFYRGEKK